MSHKIKLNFKNKDKSLEELPNQKISISLSNKINKSDKTITTTITKPNVVINSTKPVTIDQQLHKQFKKNDFSKKC